MNLDFLIAPLVVGIIGTVLAGLISLIDLIVNNYGEVKLSINDGKKVVTVKGGAPLLSSLAEHDIFLPSACGGRATCGVCKVKIKSDVGPYLPTELPFMTQGEKQKNIRLSCQVKVKANLELEIPEDLFAIQKYSTTVTSIKDLTPDIKELKLALKDPNQISFKAGQYAQLIIPPYGKIKQFTQRAYSISSSPSDRTSLEFVIRLVPGGIATTYIHTLLKAGDDLELIAPLGDFYLRESEADMLCVAGGSGMAPIKSLLFDMYEKGITKRDVYYFFGAGTAADLFYIDLLKDLEKKWRTFHFIPVVTQMDSNDKWKGETGLVTKPLEDFLAAKIPKQNPKQAYLCGSPGMIDAVIKILTAYEVNKDDIFYDKFS
ncbi:MAG: 2Fe-2S iron-sulfur cluster binding domain-containing protein [Spirochaetales bacterium]|nr:2Fe-2S iron-sulfur cluster binding domain-containing protein [Spirochaetales bacterium]